MTDLPVRVSVWKKATSGYRLRSNIHLDSPDMAASVKVAPRFNSPGPWNMTMPYGLQPQGLVKADLFRFDFRGTSETCRIRTFGIDEDETGAPLLVPSGMTAISFLGGILGWPSPAKTIDEQDSVRWYREGPAETVLTSFISANLARLGRDVVVAPSQGRGPEVTVNSEFHNVLEIVQDTATYAGLRLNVGLVDTSPVTAELRIWFDVPTVHTHDKLSAADGNLRSARSASLAPTATRAIVQAAKEKQGREVTGVNLTNDRISLKAKDSKIKTGDIITFTGGTPPTPLEVGTDYHAVKIDKDTIMVALTRSDANKGLVVDLTAWTEDPDNKVTVTEQTRRHRLRTSTGPEDVWGWPEEVFVEGDGEDANKALNQKGDQALLDGAVDNTLELEPEEVEGARYGDPFRIGDTVPYVLGTGEEGSDVIGSAELSITPDEGLVVKVTLGNPDGVDPLKKLMADVKRVKRKVRKRRED